MNEWMSDKGVCRTAPATLGLLKNDVELNIPNTFLLFSFSLMGKA